MSAASMARYAKRYIEIGMAITWTGPGAKGPRHAGWNRVGNAITTPMMALRHYTMHPSHGIAVLLGFSNLVSLDIDDIERSHLVLRHFGIDLDELKATAPCIEGRHFRLMYRAPEADLRHRTLKWPKLERLNEFDVILELRAGAVADTLPPTIHTGTHQPYRWANPPVNGFPPLPARLLELWQDWSTFNAAALALCPWAPPPPAPSKTRRAVAPSDSVIARFNAAHDVVAILEAHGYQRRGKRFAPADTTHSPGIALLDNGRVYCHHAGGALSDGHAHDAFDVYRLLDHGGDFRVAVRAAANALGLNQSAGS